MTTNAEHQRLLRLVTRASLSVASILVLAKAVAWWMSGSVSLLAGLTDSMLDAVASFLNLLAVHYALRPADDDHRFGHGKAEALAGMAQALFIAVSAVLIGLQAVERLQSPQPLGDTGAGIAVMLLSLVLTVALLAFQRKVIRVTGSTAVRADSLHYRSDLLLNSSILLALLLARFGWPQLDAIFGLAIALYILWSAVQIGRALWSAVQIARESTSILMDQELPGEVVERMQALALAIPGVQGVHDLRTRMSGSHWFVQLHLELPGELPLHEAHALCVQASAAIREGYPRADVMVHADPTRCNAARFSQRAAIVISHTGRRGAAGRGRVEAGLADRPAMTVVAVLLLLLRALAIGRIGDHVVTAAGLGFRWRRVGRRRRVDHHIVLAVGLVLVVGVGDQEIQQPTEPDLLGVGRQRVGSASTLRPYGGRTTM